MRMPKWSEHPIWSGLVVAALVWAGGQIAGLIDTAKIYQWLITPVLVDRLQIALWAGGALTAGVAATIWGAHATFRRRLASVKRALDAQLHAISNAVTESKQALTQERLVAAEERLAETQKRLAAAEAQLAEAENRKAEAPTEPAEDEVRVLKVLAGFDSRKKVHSEEIADAIGETCLRTEQVLDRLEARDLLSFALVIGRGKLYYLSPAGRDLVVAKNWDLLGGVGTRKRKPQR